MEIQISVHHFHYVTEKYDIIYVYIIYSKYSVIRPKVFGTAGLWIYMHKINTIADILLENPSTPPLLNSSPHHL